MCKKNHFYKIAIIYILLAFTFFCNQKENITDKKEAVTKAVSVDSSKRIETLDGRDVTTADFERSYETALNSISKMQNIEKSDLKEFISRDINEVPERMKAMNYQFQKKNFYDQYRQMLMIEIVAKKNGFSEKEEIQDILEQVKLQTLSTLYINEEVNKRIKITKEEIEKECQNLRKQQKQIASLPIDRCLEFAEGKLRQDMSQRIYPRVLERIKEEILVKRNEEFDLDEFLSKNEEVKKKEE